MAEAPAVKRRRATKSHPFTAAGPGTDVDVVSAAGASSAVAVLMSPSSSRTGAGEAGVSMSVSVLQLWESKINIEHIMAGSKLGREAYQAYQ
jgi:hypothetical protein